MSESAASRQEPLEPRDGLLEQGPSEPHVTGGLSDRLLIDPVAQWQLGVSAALAILGKRDDLDERNG